MTNPEYIALHQCPVVSFLKLLRDAVVTFSVDLSLPMAKIILLVACFTLQLLLIAAIVKKHSFESHHEHSITTKCKPNFCPSHILQNGSRKVNFLNTPSCPLMTSAFPAQQ